MSEPVRRGPSRLLVLAAATGAALVAFGIGFALFHDGRLAPAVLSATPSDGALRVAGWIQPGLGIDDGKGYLPVDWRDGERPRSGAYGVAAGVVRGGVLTEARFTPAWLGAAMPAPLVGDRVAHLTRHLRLVRAEQGRLAHEAPVVAVHAGGVELEGRPVAALEGGRLPAGAGGRLPALEEALREHLAARRGPATEGRIYVAADEAVPATTLGAALASATAAGATRWLLVVQGALGPGALPLEPPRPCEGAPDGTCLPADDAADPLSDLDVGAAAHVIGVAVELPEGAPPGVDGERLLAMLRADLRFKRCVAFAPDASELRLRLGLDEPEVGLSSRRIVRVAVEQARYPVETLRCLNHALGELSLPLAGEAADEVKLALELTPRADDEAAARYVAEREKRAPFLMAPTVLVERERLVVAAPFPLPRVALRHGRPLRATDRRDTDVPLEIRRDVDDAAFEDLAEVLRILADVRPDGRWPAVVTAPGSTAGELLRASLAVRGRCRDADCTTRNGGYPEVLLRTAEAGAAP